MLIVYLLVLGRGGSQLFLNANLPADVAHFYRREIDAHPVKLTILLCVGLVILTIG
ncbi:hypothetical protein TUM3792_08590 [Shewanella sp. MBTL60-007]|nr:hypothetical protein TUM3792_08590 [Shewanella sp. MBTL60-007]